MQSYFGGFVCGESRKDSTQKALIPKMFHSYGVIDLQPYQSYKLLTPTEW
ncbi:hypothetical protein [Chryseobacterium koreense]|nr:hypothetical protein [Chryseobacterium koreense]MBB5332782.1 hypothetical protein [Chryseobacterium koreense]